MDWRYNTLWVDQLADGVYRSINFSDKSQANFRFDGFSYARSIKFKSGTQNLEDFPADENTLHVELHAANIESFSGLSRFKRIKRLEVHGCSKLTSDQGLTGACGSLEWLHIHESKKFQISDELLSLCHLKVLGLNVCGPLPDLEFLSAFPKLVSFRFVDTNVLNGDLTPLFRHPSLCFVGFMNKRHYNVKERQADEFFMPKHPPAIAKTYKGKFETFRYLALGDA